MCFGFFSERVKTVGGNMPEVQRVYWDRGGVSVPRRKPETHKGDYGKLLIVGGSVGYTGAPNLCARAAVRSGAGLVYLGVPEAIWSVCAVKNDEAMPFPLPCDDSGKLTAGAFSPLREYFARCGVLALGPGLGRSDGTAALTAALVRKFPGKIVLDADALWAVSLAPDILREAQGEIVVVDKIALGAIKTKDFRSFLSAVKADGKAAVITPEVNEVVVKSARNLPGVTTAPAKLINVYDLLNAKTLVIDKEALAVIEEVFA